LIPRLVLASKNQDKLREIEAILLPIGMASEIVRDLDWPDVEESGDTLEENALLKGRAVAEATGLPSVADDTGLEVDALGGAPGVHTARFAGPRATYSDNVRKLLEAMAGISRRQARFRTVAALVFPDGSEVTAEGAIHGVISEEPRGAGGFGYDPVFEVGGRTLAEMEDGHKNQMSHRAAAFRALAARLGLPTP
jgi:XTP/dITP diphosphohydrolase